MTTIRQSLEVVWAAARNLALGGNLAALRLLGSPRKLLTYAGESLFLLRSITGRPGVMDSHVAAVLGAGPVRDITLANLDGETWLQTIPSYATDLVSLCLICRIIEPRVVFEIGTLNGYTALHLALNAPDDALVYTLDLPAAEASIQPALRTTLMDDAHIQASRRSRRVFEGTGAASRIIPLSGDSARFDFSPYHGTVDFFFIDGAHSYDYVASDTRNAFACVRPGGVVAWHDFGRVGVNGVTRLVREVAGERPVRAVPGGSLAFTVA